MGPLGARILGVAAAVVVMATLVGCGDDDDEGGDAAGPTTSSLADDEGSSDDEDGSEDDDSNAPPAASGECPLTAEQVSEVLGAPVEEAACTFFPPADAASAAPNANIIRQVAFACEEEARAEVGYEEPLDGFDVDAYVKRETVYGDQILVCVDPPLEIWVDMLEDHEGAVAAAEELARLVIEAG